MNPLILGDSLEVSNHDGNFTTSQLESSSHVIMFAAGTGFTPMAGLINAALTTHTRKDR